MSQKLTVSTKGLGTFEPYEGDGPSAWLPFDGEYRVLVKKAQGKLSSTGKVMIATTLSVLDDDAKGMTLYNNCVISGEDSKGNSLNRHLGELLFSAGRSLDEIRALEEKGEIDVDLVCQSITQEGRNIAYVTAATEEYQGKFRSATNFVRPAKYKENKDANTHRRPRASTEPKQPAAPSNGAPAAGHGGAPNGAAAGLSDQVSANI